MTWITGRQALSMIGAKKLAQLTNEAGQQEFIGIGDGSKQDFTTPFIFGLDLKLYTNAVLSYTVAVDFVHEERLVATFPTPPAAGAILTASSTDSVNADNLDSALLRAQALVCGALKAAVYKTPVDDAPDVKEPLLGWMAAITWYLLATDPRRPRLLEAYPELEKRYIDVYGGVDSDLKRVAKGTFSLSGILESADSAATLGPGDGDFISNPVVYTPDRFRGVL